MVQITHDTGQDQVADFHRINLLGPFTLRAGGKEVALGGLRQRAVLALLAVRANEVIARDTIIDQVWAGQPPPSAVSTLQGYVSHLRRALANTPFELVSTGPGYMLSAADGLIDAHRFGTLTADARRLLTQGRAAEAVGLLDEALELWRGPAMADFLYEDFARTEAARLDDARMAAVSLRIEAKLTLGLHGAVTGELEQLVREQPLREDFRAQLMRALAAGGRRVEALRVYQDGRKVFAEELGLDPSTSLQRLERAILDQEPATDVSGGPLPGAAELPTPTTSFVGRAEELASLVDLIGSRRLVTVTGAGGVGKTRLAVELARTVGGGQPDGVFLVQLADITDADLILPTIAAVLGVPLQPDLPIVTVVKQALASRSCLVLLDGCEHIASGAAGVVATLLQAGPDVRVIATSRQPLGLASETVWPIPTLEVPDASAGNSVERVGNCDSVRLFAERAEAAWPGFRLSEANAGAVARICQRLDGIPLAIELAAARLRSLSVDQVADRLDDRFRLLSSGDRTALPRHRTLQASVEWSYDLLTAQERALLVRAAVFSGPFDLEAAEAICSGGPVTAADVVPLCGELVDKSLLSRVQGSEEVPRYRMLETIRQFAWERLPDDEADHLRARHADEFTRRSLEAVSHLHTPSAGNWVDRLDSDRPDIRTALEWLTTEGDANRGLELATGLWLYWRYRDEPIEGQAWIARALARGDHERPGRLAAAVGRARLALLGDDQAATEAAYTEGMALLTSADDGPRGHLLAVEAELMRFLGTEREAAVERAEAAIELFRGQGDRYWEAHARRVLCQLRWDGGDLMSASTLAAQCLTLFEACGDAEGIAGAKIMLAGLARDRGDMDTARDLYRESLAAFRTIRQPWGHAEAARSYGALVLAEGDVDGAAKLAAESLRVCENLGLGRGIGQSCELLAGIALERGDIDEAEQFVRRAFESLDEHGYPGDMAVCSTTAGQIALQQGRINSATQLLQAAASLSVGFGHRRSPAMALALLARAYSRAANPAAASLAHEALDLARSAGNVRATVAALNAMAEVLVAEGDATQAARLALVARYTLQGAGMRASRAESVDNADTLARIAEALRGSELEQPWTVALASGVVDLGTLEKFAATPEIVLSPLPDLWDGAERRGGGRRGDDRRTRSPDLALSPTADRRSTDRRRWQRRRSDRVP